MMVSMRLGDNDEAPGMAHAAGCSAHHRDRPAGLVGAYPGRVWSAPGAALAYTTEHRTVETYTSLIVHNCVMLLRKRTCARESCGARAGLASQRREQERRDAVAQGPSAPCLS